MVNIQILNLIHFFKESYANQMVELVKRFDKKTITFVLISSTSNMGPKSGASLAIINSLRIPG